MVNSINDMSDTQNVSQPNQNPSNLTQSKNSSNTPNTSTGPNQADIENEEAKKRKEELNKAKIFGGELTADNLSKVHLGYNGDKVSEIKIDGGSNIGVNVAATHQALAGKSGSSEFDIKIGENKVHYKIDGKQIHADMGGMSKEVAASDEALKINLNDADAKYGKVSIQIDPNTMKPALVFDKDPELTPQQMKEAQQDLVKIYGNDKKGGKNAAMSIKGEGAEIAFKDLALMSGNEMETKKSQIRGDLSEQNEVLAGISVSNGVGRQQRQSETPQSQTLQPQQQKFSINRASNELIYKENQREIKVPLNAVEKNLYKSFESSNDEVQLNGVKENDLINAIKEVQKEQNQQQSQANSAQPDGLRKDIEETSIGIVEGGIVVRKKGDFVERDNGSIGTKDYKNEDFDPFKAKASSSPNVIGSGKGQNAMLDH